MSARAPRLAQGLDPIPLDLALCDQPIASDPRRAQTAALCLVANSRDGQTEAGRRLGQGDETHRPALSLVSHSRASERVNTVEMAVPSPLRLSSVTLMRVGLLSHAVCTGAMIWTRAMPSRFLMSRARPAVLSLGLYARFMVSVLLCSGSNNLALRGQIVKRVIA